ncbi:MAG: hypothetical protein R2845_01415 [Thermomicrobiales bacterium]
MYSTGSAGSVLPDVARSRSAGGERGGGDFEVIPEYLVVADLERANAGLFAFGSFEIGDPLAGFGGPAPVLVEFGREAGVEDIAFAGRSGRFLNQRGIEEIANRSIDRDRPTPECRRRVRRPGNACSDALDGPEFARGDVAG